MDRRVYVRKTRARGCCPDCGRPLRLARMVDDSELEADCPCGYRTTVRRGARAFKLLAPAVDDSWRDGTRGRL